MTGRPSTITVEQREEFWRRYKAGESVLGIIGALRQRPGNSNRVLEASGGIAPMPRRRSERVLRFGEREEISRGLAAGDSLHVIAKRLNRAVSTVSQARHGGRRGIGPLTQIRRLGSRPVDRSFACSAKTSNCDYLV
jgi:hypothetical protein